ncbi:stage V sporulation protein AC [Clostridium botulinum]|uniref:Stage V sporulation protein AC n=5 Tax=Clostridium botulinum TaxID=1491 RepID=A5I6G7_CLOBH|nr:stage V sporulation protein AC [Clostridium botulinum]EKX79037.1 SpoVA family protein [Clostridium botulinum CFSAN001628]NFK36643.1 stage V sporulation protein AC [Clostridium botulinum H04402 065]ABS33926.1 stage V sporulation protein AC [Clostridium botulinum A str. ATCC 19397]ABS36378.1 stage V sporulation protein AC [Clostridium botulinum A str. Hall]ABS40790.1 stage V sporulation protein AC [Clostridium botulinum F str. Langeland]
MALNEKKLRKDFDNLSPKIEPKPQIFKHCVSAFIVGGLICDVGQFFNNFFLTMGIPKDEVGTYVSIVMVFIGAFLTGIGVYDKIAKFAGAGTVVPITGFANSIVSPAMEFKQEGYVFGVAAKMFVIAGPVLVYGIGSSVIVGIIYFIMSKL